MSIVAIVGRPNVGKSTLFNRLTGSRDAIVDPTAGVTRDRHYGTAEWTGHEFTVIDTGGYVSDSPDVFDKEIRKQVKVALEEATLLVFVVDAMEGITDLDEEMAAMLRKSGKPVFLVANKVDTPDKIAYGSEFYKFGLGEVYAISSINGSGTGELLDEIVKKLPDDTKPDEELADLPRIAIAGRPNVGKSSFLNALTGEERNIVTPVAGTTRDAVNTRFKGFGHDLLLIDTAGLRKKGKVDENLEFYSVMRTIRAIEYCDVVMLMIDATQGIESQDLNIFHLAERNHKGIVILVNKWDLIEKDNHTLRQFESDIRQTIAPFTDVPILFVSALTKQRVLKALEAAMEVYANRRRKITTRDLNEVMLPIIENNPPPAYKGKYIKVKFCTQLPTYAPSFAFFCNLPQYIRDPYKRFVENKLREHYNFTGVPVSVFFRKK